MSMIAIHNLDVSSAFWYLADLLEVADLHGVEILESYDRARMQNLLHKADTISHTDLFGSASPDKKTISEWLGKELHKAAPETLKSIILAKAVPSIRPGHCHQSDRTRRTDRGRDRDRSRSKGKPREDQMICFSHDPANGKTCDHKDKKDRPCRKQHLDTNEASAKTRFDNAKGKFGNSYKGGR